MSDTEHAHDDTIAGLGAPDDRATRALKIMPAPPAPATDQTQRLDLMPPAPAAETTQRLDLGRPCPRTAPNRPFPRLPT